ncbi:threonylcarbamoyl-AMP synthase [Brumimicrobium glaciale]|jgi:tRNA threonylcarbamoyl adenosine modification protein (Sua5/YciO/YrdC/YwlC family)|uniref:Threonylcarbamoyl-AMP synthase n=1 Tax=Brumimicrobium glaciale TaxID=200475 RepID=A0A4Q4KN96_9FLAO|nr:L-threonylcarbamoyladenylate synthase [Brumimicrobium glaciale]RYM34618.1 threonylcarbamoyl-AMP synthase [Brumimicrobium glaciale]
MLIEINNNNIDKRLIDDIVKELRKGEIIIYPTDSVYAIGCDLKNKKALEKLAKFKGMKLKQSKFSIICKDLSQVSEYVKHLPQPTFKMMKKSLPGPFTYILNASSEVTKLFDTNRTELGIKIPDNNIVLAIVEALGNPLVTTSLNNNEDEMLEYFIDPYKIYEQFDEQVNTIIDGGPGKLEASTVIDCTGDAPEIIRQGVGQLD